MREQDVRQIVHREVQLVAIAAGLPIAAVPHAGVVHEHVDALVVAEDGLREGTDLVERREVRGIEPRAAAPGLLDLGHHGRATFAIAAVHDDVGALGGDPQCHVTTKAIGRPRDEHRAPTHLTRTGGRLPACGRTHRSHRQDQRRRQRCAHSDSSRPG